MHRSVIGEIAKAYGIVPQVIQIAQKGYRNQTHRIVTGSGESVNIICYKRESGIVERIRRSDSISQGVSRAGLPVRTPYDGRILHVGGGVYAGVYSYLPGHTIAWENYTMKHIKLLGWAMSDLHGALNGVSYEPKYLLSEEMRSLHIRILRYFSTANVRDAMRSKLNVNLLPEALTQYSSLLQAIDHSRGNQYLHMDMVRGNVLFRTNEPLDMWQIGNLSLCGIIDFEKTAYGVAVCDVARTLAFLYVDCDKPTEKIQKYFLQSGYIKRGGRTLDNIELLGPLISFFLVYDFYKFLLHTPYESLEQNRHYVRTRDLLIEYGIIATYK